MLPLNFAPSDALGPGDHTCLCRGKLMVAELLCELDRPLCAIQVLENERKVDQTGEMIQCHPGFQSGQCLDGKKRPEFRLQFSHGLPRSASEGPRSSWPWARFGFSSTPCTS